MANKRDSENTPTDEHPLIKANEQGYLGTVPDPTPNEAYTLAGVTSGQPTPETDPELRAEAEQRAEEILTNPDGDQPTEE